MSTEVWQQAIAEAQALNARANEELMQQLHQMREQLGANYNPPPSQVWPEDYDSEHYRRIMLTASRWASEVITAAVLDEDFKNTTEQAAQAILREHGRLPPVENTEPTPTTE